MQLNTQQQQALQELNQFLKAKDEQYIILTGFAGTGKSTLLKELYQTNKINWVFTATTNKAKQALSGIMGIDVVTIHSLLHLTPYSKSSNTVISNCVLVIDECSYIDYNLLNIIKQSCQCKVIFVGDDTQLTPIGLNHCPVFEQGYKTVRLETIVRQQSATDLMQVCHQLRNCILAKDILKPLIESDNLIKLNRTSFDDLLKQEFTRTDWQTNDSKLLAIKNSTVNRYNKLLYQLVYGRKQYSVGDVVINNHFVDGVKTDEQVTILEIESVTVEGIKGNLFTLQGDKGINKLFMPNDSRKIKTLSKVYKNIADLRPAYACTIHKSQGSTYNKVFIDLKDFHSFKGTQQELARLLYVAISRAKYQVIVTED